jgi:hypothetical protein
MDKNFIVESKSFTFSVLGGASTLRVEEKRKYFLGVVILNSQSSEWLTSTLEVLLGFPEEQDFVKSFKEGLKVLIAQRSGNKAGCFLEATTFGLGGRKGSILIPEGRGGWRWLKFSNELRKVVDFLCLGGLQARFLIYIGEEGCERCSADSRLGYKVDRAFFCEGVEVGFDHCCEGLAHHGLWSFLVKGFVGGTL